MTVSGTVRNILDENRADARSYRGRLSRAGARTRKQILDSISRKERRAFRQGVELDYDVEHVSSAAFTFGRDDHDGILGDWVDFTSDLDDAWVPTLAGDEPPTCHTCGVRMTEAWMCSCDDEDDDEDDDQQRTWVVDPALVETIDEIGEEIDGYEALAWSEAGWGGDRFDSDDIQWGFVIDSTLVRRTRSEFTRGIHRAPEASWPYGQLAQRAR